MARWKRPSDGPVTPTRAIPEVAGPLIQPTEEEARNGWTAETLTDYVRQRQRAQAAKVFPEKPPRPTMANSKYNPLRCWR